MESINPQYRLPLLQDPDWLDELDEPRVASCPGTGMPAGRYEFFEHRIVGSNDTWFQNPGHHERIHQAIGEYCNVEKTSWPKMSTFMSRLLGDFYKDPVGHPAWITVTPRRFSFRERNKQLGLRPEQFPARPQPMGPPGDLSRQRLELGRIAVPCDGLKMVKHRDARWGDTRAVKQRIERRILRPGEQTSHTSVQELWWFLATPDDEEAARSGKVPALGEAYDEETGVVNAPIVTLCKLTGRYEWVDGLALQVCPATGAIYDFRWFQYDLNFYCNNCGPTHDLLVAVLTKGHWEKF